MQRPHRPTFHESWQRIAALRPRLRPSVQVVRQDFRGEPWHVVQDASGTDYARINASGSHFLGLLDGSSSIQECWDACNETLGDAAPTQGEVVQLLGRLTNANLLLSDAPSDADAMLRRYEQRKGREFRSALSSLLFLRIPLWNPDRFLASWSFATSWLFSPLGLALWVGVIALGLWQLAGRGSELFSGASSVLDMGNLPLLYVVFVLTKLVHEFGHGFAAKVLGTRQGTGGRVLTMGVMFLVFVPFPYVDTSSAWLLRSRWHRIVVAASGMMAELVLAAIAAVVWARAGDGTLAKAIAYNAMFVSGLTTILFNANPLMKYDGYFILSDLLGMPNLSQRATQHLKMLVKRHVWRVPRLDDVEHDPAQRRWLVVYGLTSLVYRTLIVFGILWFVAQQLFILGLLAAAFCFVTFAVVPLTKLIRYLATSAEVARVRSRAVLSTLAFTAALLALLGLVPVPDHTRVEGVVEANRTATIFAGADGFVSVVSMPGAVSDDAPLVDATSAELDVQRRVLLAKRDKAIAQRRIALASEPGEAQRLAEVVATLDRQIDTTQERINALRVMPPFAGAWVSPEADTMQGRFAPRGGELGSLHDTSALVVRAFAPQWAGAHLIAHAPSHADVRARMRPESRTNARVERVVNAGQERLPALSMAIQAGGTLRTDPSDSKNQRLAEAIFEWRLALDHPDGFFPGQRVVARFRTGDTPVLAQGYRWLRQQIQRRFEV